MSEIFTFSYMLTALNVGNLLNRREMPQQAQSLLRFKVGAQDATGAANRALLGAAA